MLKLVDVLSVAADVARVDEDAVSEDAGVVRDLGVADHHDHHLQAVQELLHGMDAGREPRRARPTGRRP